jgi:hypothetical protein
LEQMSSLTLRAACESHPIAPYRTLSHPIAPYRT